MPRVPGLLERIQQTAGDRAASRILRAAIGVGAVGILAACGIVTQQDLGPYAASPVGSSGPAAPGSGAGLTTAAWPIALSTSLDTADDPYGPYHVAFQYSYAAAPGNAFPGFILNSGVADAAGQTVANSTATISPGATASGTGFLTVPALTAGSYTLGTFAMGASGTALSATSTWPLTAQTPVVPDVASLAADLNVPVTTYAVTAKDPAGKSLTFSWRMTGEACGSPLVPWNQTGAALVRWSHSGNAPDSCKHAGTDHDVTTSVTITTTRGVSVVCTIRGSEDLVIPYPICPSALTAPSAATVPTSGGTDTLTAGGRPVLTTIGSSRAIQTSFTSNSNGPVTAIVYAVVHNSAGQTVAYSTATLSSVAPGASATAYNMLTGVAPGTYSITLFATSTNGTAISGTSTVTVTLP